MLRKARHFVMLALTGVVVLPNCSLVYDFKESERSKMCGDGLDNNADKLIDCEDPECFSSDCPEICDDELNNDGDPSGPDCKDEDCNGHCPEESADSCEDGWDNDGDGLTDGEDPRCWGHRPIQAASCLSSDPSQLAFDLFDLPDARRRFSDENSEFVSSALDGDWAELSLDLWLITRGVDHQSSSDEGFGGAGNGAEDAPGGSMDIGQPADVLEFGIIEIALIPAAIGDAIPEELTSVATSYIRLTPRSVEVWLNGELVHEGDLPGRLTWDEGKWWFVSPNGDVIPKPVDALPSSQLSRLVVRAPQRDTLRNAQDFESPMIEGEGCMAKQLSWTLELHAPGHLPCGVFWPTRERAEDRMSACDLPAELEASQPLPVVPAASVGIAPDGRICRSTPPPLGLADGRPIPLVSHSVSWDMGEQVWQAVGWTAAHDLVLYRSENCLSWSLPQRIYTAELDLNVGVPSWVAGGTFAYPMDRTTTTQLPTMVLYTVRNDQALELMMLAFSAEKDAWEPPRKVYDFTRTDRDDYVEEPVRVVTLGEHELAIIYRMSQSLDSGLGALIGTQIGRGSWDFQRLEPWPFVSPSRNPGTVDAEGIEGGVLSFWGTEGLLYIDGRPDPSFPVIDDDRTGLYKIVPAELDPATSPLVFPAHNLVKYCDNDGQCSPGETCRDCPDDCSCAADLLFDACWIQNQTPFAPARVNVFQFLHGFATGSLFNEQQPLPQQFQLRGKIFVPREDASDSCVTQVSLVPSAQSFDKIPILGLAFAGQPLLSETFDITVERQPTVFSEWVFEFERTETTLSRKVWNPAGCQVIDSTVQFQAQVPSLIRLEVSDHCPNVLIRELDLLEMDNDQ